MLEAGNNKYKAVSVDGPAVSSTQEDRGRPQWLGKPSLQGDAFKAVTNDAT